MIHFATRSIRWRGLSAPYTFDERKLMSALPVREQAILHLLKSFTPGEIQEGSRVKSPSVPGLDGDTAAIGHGLNDGTVNVAAPAYIDHEDIPFGEIKRGKRPIYALVWTPAHHKVCKTKAKATKKTRAWKKWKERQGWKVTSHDSGYFAARGTEREAITLHEYDRDTKMRTK